MGRTPEFVSSIFLSNQVIDKPPLSPIKSVKNCIEGLFDRYQRARKHPDYSQKLTLDEKIRLYEEAGNNIELARELGEMQGILHGCSDRQIRGHYAGTADTINKLRREELKKQAR